MAVNTAVTKRLRNAICRGAAAPTPGPAAEVGDGLQGRTMAREELQGDQ